MKRILLFLLIAFPGILFAQNVGIGTTTPAARLDVLGAGNTAATNVLLARNANSDTLLKVKGDGGVFIGNPLVPDVLNYKFRVETGASRGSLFIENPVLTANTTLRVLRGVPEAAENGHTTALDVESAGDVAALFQGVGGIEATATSPSFPAATFTAAPTGFAINANGKLRFGNNGEGAGKTLTSDATGNATWQDPTVAAHTHFGENWIGNGNSGLSITNSNTTYPGSAIFGWMTGGGSQTNGAVQGFTNSTGGLGVIGINFSTGSYAPVFPNCGVAGATDGGIGVYGSSLTGAAIYGYKGAAGGTGNAGVFQNDISTNTDPAVLITTTSANPNPTALELRNGFIKVSGNTKTAFKITATAGNIVSNRIKLSYTGMAATDIVIAVHNYSGNYIGATGVWWDGTEWTVFREDVANMPTGESFNIMVIKQ